MKIDTTKEKLQDTGEEVETFINKTKNPTTQQVKFICGECGEEYLEEEEADDCCVYDP